MVVSMEIVEVMSREPGRGCDATRFRFAIGQPVGVIDRAMRAVRKAAQETPYPEQIRILLFGNRDWWEFQAALDFMRMQGNVERSAFPDGASALEFRGLKCYHAPALECGIYAGSIS